RERLEQPGKWWRERQASDVNVGPQGVWNGSIEIISSGGLGLFAHACGARDQRISAKCLSSRIPNSISAGRGLPWAWAMATVSSAHEDSETGSRNSFLELALSETTIVG